MKIILASQSPRRVQIMQKLGLDFEQFPSNFEEYFDESRSSQEIAEELGLGKALDVARNYPEAVVIGSDLVIDLDGIQLGKPENKEEAIKQLQKFNGKTQKLISSVAVVCLDKNYQKVSSETTKLTINGLTKDFCEKYISNHDTLDFAGGYSIRHQMIKDLNPIITGRRDTILGMPSNLVCKFLHDLGIDCEPLHPSDDLPL